MASLTVLIKLSRFCAPVSDVFTPVHTFPSGGFSAHHSSGGTPKPNASSCSPSSTSQAQTYPPASLEQRLRNRAASSLSDHAHTSTHRHQPPSLSPALCSGRWHRCHHVQILRLGCQPLTPTILYLFSKSVRIVSPLRS